MQFNKYTHTHTHSTVPFARPGVCPYALYQGGNRAQGTGRSEQGRDGKERTGSGVGTESEAGPEMGTGSGVGTESEAGPETGTGSGSGTGT